MIMITVVCISRTMWFRVLEQCRLKLSDSLLTSQYSFMLDIGTFKDNLILRHFNLRLRKQEWRCILYIVHITKSRVAANTVISCHYSVILTIMDDTLSNWYYNNFASKLWPKLILCIKQIFADKKNSPEISFLY